MIFVAPLPVNHDLMAGEPARLIDWSAITWLPEIALFSQPELIVAALTTDPGTKRSLIVPRASRVVVDEPVSCDKPAIAKIAPVFGFKATA